MRLFFWPFPSFQSMRAQQSAAWAGDEGIKEAKNDSVRYFAPTSLISPLRKYSPGTLLFCQYLDLRKFYPDV
jgi:hypothetical protein